MLEKIKAKELKELFNQIKSNDDTAFEEFYTKYNKLIYKIAFSILKNKSDAEDITPVSYTHLTLPTNREV